MDNTYYIAYRVGGTKLCTWRKVLEAYASHDEALEKAQEIERMGYKTRIFSYRELETVGLPIGWEAGLVKWDQDKIEVSQFETHWQAA